MRSLCIWHPFREGYIPSLVKTLWLTERAVLRKVCMHGVRSTVNKRGVEPVAICCTPSPVSRVASGSEAMATHGVERSWRCSSPLARALFSSTIRLALSF